MSRASQHSSNIELNEVSRIHGFNDDNSTDRMVPDLTGLFRDTPPPNSVPSPDSTDEIEPPEAGKLRPIDVFGLIINKMIGTGIYTNPAMVLTLTGSRETALLFWIIGLVYTYMSVFIYLSCASVIPYNSGELLYLDELTSHGSATAATVSGNRFFKWLRLFMGNGLFAYTVSAFIFVATFNSATNCMQIARQLLILINPHEDLPQGGILRAIAVCALSIVCLLHFFSPRWGRALNVKFALIKIGLLLVVVIVGSVLWGNHKTIAQFNPDIPVGSSDHAKALLLVIFAFAGWENANWVAGEIPRNRHFVLRKGFLWAVTVVSSLYIAVNVVFLFGLIEYTKNDTAPHLGRGVFSTVQNHLEVRGNLAPIKPGSSIAPLFFGNSSGAVRWWGFFTAFSATGSVISIVYTFSRVKQAIGRMNILPWSTAWGSDDNLRHPANTGDLEKTPMGGLILHWITTVASICATISITNVLNAISFPGLLQSVAHAVILIPLGIVFVRLRSRATALGFDRSSLRPFDRVLTSIWLDNNVVVVSILTVMVLAYIICNAFLIVGFIIPPYKGVDGWIAPTIVGILVAIAAIYYFSCFGAYLFNADADLAAFPSELGSDTRAHTMRVPRSLLAVADVKMKIEKSVDFDESTLDTRRFGSRRRITYPVGRNANFLYWFFGGRELDITPWQRVKVFCNQYLP